MNHQLQLFSRVLVLISCVLLLGCESRTGESALKAARQKANTNPKEALSLYSRVMQVNKNEPIALTAALEASSLCHKEKSCAENEEYYLRYIIKNSDSEAEQIQAQKRLAEGYYEKGFYPHAINEMNRLLSKSNFKDGRLEIKIKLAKSNFYIKNFYQSEVELNSYLKEAKTDEDRFHGYLLRADINAANKKYKDAMETYKEIQAQFRDLYFRNQVYMNEALLLEEQKFLDEAVVVLESVRDHVDQNRDFIDSKIERLKERKALMPGASGRLRR